MTDNVVPDPKVVLVSEFPPPAAGMTVQADQLLSRLLEAGCKIQPLRTNPQFPASLSILEKIRFLRGFIKLLIFLGTSRKLFNADIVHIFSSSGLNYYLFTLAPLLIAKLAGAKTIVNFHGGGAQRFFSKRHRLLEWSMKLTDKLVVPSGYLQYVYKEFGITAQIIGNIANVEQFAFRLKKIETPVVISARNLTPIYNIACALKAFAIVQDAYPDAILYVAGDGSERQKLESLRDELKLQNVYFLGNLKNTELVQYLDKANLFVNTSTVDNMPISIIEAFAIGLPVVSTNVGGIPYLVDHERTGILVNSDDHQALGNSLIRIIQNRDLAEFLVKNAYHEVQSFTGDKIKILWLDAYNQLAGQK